jgi:hypothetical protein
VGLVAGAPLPEAEADRFRVTTGVGVGAGAASPIGFVGSRRSVGRRVTVESPSLLCQDGLICAAVTVESAKRSPTASGVVDRELQTDRAIRERGGMMKMRPGIVIGARTTSVCAR